MARPSKRQETESFEVTVPKATFDALVRLATYSTYGWTENMVAVNLLNERIRKMQTDNEHGLSLPDGGPTGVVSNT